MSACRVCTAPTDAFMCKACAGELERAIAEMPSLFHEMSVVATGQTRVYRANGRGSEPEQPEEPEAELIPFLRSPHARMTLSSTRLMVNLDARELMWVCGNTLSSWTRHLAESRGAGLPTAEAMIGWLLTHITSIRMDEAAAEMHEEVTALHRQMVTAVDRSPSRVYAGPCHAPLAAGSKCRRPLYAWFEVWHAASDDDGRTITCDGYRPPNDRLHNALDVGCRATHTPAERAEWLLAELDDMLMPSVFWQSWLPKLRPDLAWPNRSTWWRWRESARLEIKTVDRDGEELFRGGDVIDLVVREQPRIMGNRSKGTRRRADVA